MATSPDDLTDEERALLESAFDLARNGGVAELRGLLDAGLPPNLTNTNGDTLLILAAYHRHTDVVDVLLAAGADTERVNDKGQTALSAATFRQDEPIVRALLAAGADPDAGSQSARSVTRFFGLDAIAAIFDEA